jgi:hypothetical protein
MRLALIPILLLWLPVPESGAAEHIVLIPSQRSLNEDRVIPSDNNKEVTECICVPEIRYVRGTRIEVQVCRELAKIVYEIGTLIIGSTVQNCQKI